MKNCWSFSRIVDSHLKLSGISVISVAIACLVIPSVVSTYNYVTRVQESDSSFFTRRIAYVALNFIILILIANSYVTAHRKHMESSDPSVIPFPTEASPEQVPFNAKANATDSKTSESANGTPILNLQRENEANCKNPAEVKPESILRSLESMNAEGERNFKTLDDYWHAKRLKPPATLRRQVNTEAPSVKASSEIKVCDYRETKQSEVSCKGEDDSMDAIWHAIHVNGIPSPFRSSEASSSSRSVDRNNRDNMATDLCKSGFNKESSLDALRRRASAFIRKFREQLNTENRQGSAEPLASLPEPLYPYA